MKQASLICATILLMLIVGTLFATFYGKQEVQKVMLTTAYARIAKLEQAHNQLQAAHNQLVSVLAQKLKMQAVDPTKETKVENR